LTLPLLDTLRDGLMQPAWIALGLSLKVALWATLLDVIAGVALGYLLARTRFPGRDTLDALLTLPMVMPPTVLGYYLLVIIGRNGPLGHWLQQFGINLIFTWQAAVLAAAVVAFPLVLKAARSAFETVDTQLEDAARVLGVSGFGVFLRVTLPLGATLMVAGSIPGKTQTLSIAVYEAVQAGQDDTANVLVLITSVTCVTVLLLANRLTPNRLP
jgi:molybdate transport system permease protein